MDMINVSKLSKSYKKHQAVKDVSFTVKTGAVFGLIGLNGAGKTTTIKSIIGLIKKFDGTVQISGEKWGTVSYRRHFAYLPELFSPHQYLTGKEYIECMQNLHNAKYDEAQINKLCESFAFDKENLKKRTNTYSKGMTQKLGLIQSIASPAELLILDEPMSGLDPEARALFKQALGEVTKSGRTIFLSTHILHDIETLCTDIAVLHKGELLYSGTPSDFIKKNEVSDLEQAFVKEIRSK